MADVITRLKLESGEYDSKVKRATQGLLQMEQECRNAGKSLATLEKEQKQYVQSLGSMQTVSTTVRGKLGELTQAYTELRVQYNRLTEEEKKGDFGKALSSSLDQLNQRIQQTKKELSDVNKELSGMDKLEAGGLFGGSKISGMLQVFGGNVMTKGFEMAAGAVSSMVNEIGDCIKQGVELAKQGEGIRIAFERLGRGDILQGLREATHGTVTDLELMKAAVKFNDFKLPLDELGTMLAFAQQKAKDTGQDVNYLVDSIVTGLGRKSLMILDNLGLSATEIRERMKETGDMTKAVGAIIRDQMAKSGDYIETAADRAAQANVSLQNKMEELGRKFAPVEEASNQLWTSMKIGILDIVGGPLAKLLNGLTEAGRLQNMLNNLNGEGDNTNVGSQLKKLQAIRKAGGSSYMFNSTLSGMTEDYNRQIMALDDQIKNGGKPIGGGSGSSQDVRYLQRQMDALKIMRDELRKGAQDILNPKTQNATTTTTTKPKKGAKEKELTELQQNQQKINDLTQEYVKLGDESTESARERQAEIQKEIALLEKRNGLLGLRAEQAQGRFLVGAGDFQRDGLSNNPGTLLKAPDTTIPSGGLQLSDKAMDAVNKSLNNQKKDVKGVANEWMSVTSAIQSVATAMSSIEDPAAKVMGIVAQAIATVALAFAQSLKGSVTIWDYIAGAAAGVATMISTISAIHSATGYAEGGMIKGNSYSGDNLMAMGPNGLIGLNAGEIVLNKSQQNNLASQLQGNPMGGLNLTATIRGEQIRLALNNNGRRTGRGEYVQSNRR